MKSVNCSKPGYITCSQNSNIPYNLIFTTKFNDSSILITIISWEYLNMSLANEYVGDVPIPTQPRLSSITNFFSRRISQSDCSKLFLYIQTLQIISSYSLYLLHYNILLNFSENKENVHILFF